MSKKVERRLLLISLLLSAMFIAFFGRNAYQDFQYNEILIEMGYVGIELDEGTGTLCDNGTTSKGYRAYNFRGEAEIGLICKYKGDHYLLPIKRIAQ